MQDVGKGVELKGGSLHGGFGGLVALMVLAVLETTLPFFNLSCKIQDNEATVTVSTVLAASAVLAVSVVTATHFWPKGIFRGRGVGVYILRPHAAGILYHPPPFYTPPTPRRVFQGWGGGGV